jgi:hypothetical protein
MGSLDDADRLALLLTAVSNAEGSRQVSIDGVVASYLLLTFN